MASSELRTEIKDFLTTRRARISPDRTGLPASGDNRRVRGLRRAEVAVLAGVSVDYYVRLERGGLRGASDAVLDALASALQLDEAERGHLFHLARRSIASGDSRDQQPPASVRPALQRVLDAITDAPAWICNSRYDVLVTNQLSRALFSPVLADARRPANTARFVYLASEAARTFFTDYDHIAHDIAAKLRMDVGRSPNDEGLLELVDELTASSARFRQQWASQDVQLHRSGRKRLHHPVVGRLDLDVETMELPARTRLHMTVYTAPAGTAGANGLARLAAWAGGRQELPADSRALG